MHLEKYGLKIPMHPQNAMSKLIAYTCLDKVRVVKCINHFVRRHITWRNNVIQKHAFVTKTKQLERKRQLLGFEIVLHPERRLRGLSKRRQKKLENNVLIWLVLQQDSHEHWCKWLHCCNLIKMSRKTFSPSIHADCYLPCSRRVNCYFLLSKHTSPDLTTHYRCWCT